MANVVLPHNWAPRDYQMKLWQALHNGCRNVLWIAHRSGGKDWLALNWTAEQTVVRPGLYWHTLPYFVQARDVAWNNTTNEGKCYRSAFPGWENPGAANGIVLNSNDHEMRLEIAGGSIWKLMGADKVDRLRGPNPLGNVYSEYAFMNPLAADTVEPKLKANGGWQIYITTPNGKNHCHRLLQYAREHPWHPIDNPNGWFAEVLTVDDTRDENGRPIVTDEQITELRKRGKSEEFIQREYYCSFNTAVEGAYYGKIMMQLESSWKENEVAWRPELPVNTAWDIGHDGTSIWFFQYVGDFVHVIDYFNGDNMGFLNYARAVKNKPYVYDQHYGPHDLSHREFMGGGGKTRAQLALQHDIRFRILPKLSIDEGIESSRSLMYRCKFNTKACAKGLDALREYHRQVLPGQYDADGNQMFADHPEHDWTSHAADAFRYMSLAAKTPEQLNRKKLPNKAVQSFSYF